MQTNHFTLKMYTGWLLTLLVCLLSYHSTDAIVCFIQDSVNYTTGDSRLEKMVAPRMTGSSEEHTQCIMVHFFVIEGGRDDPGAVWRLQPVASKAHFDTENLLRNRCTLAGFTVDAPLYGAIVCSCDEDFCNRMDYDYELLHSKEFGDIEKLASQALLDGTKGIYDHNVDDSKLACLARSNWTDYILRYKNQLIVATGIMHECYQPNARLEVPREYLDTRKSTNGQLEIPYVSFDWLGNAIFNTATMTLRESLADKLNKPGRVTTFVIYGTKRLKKFLGIESAPSKTQKALSASANSSDSENEPSVLDELVDENGDDSNTTLTKNIFIIFNTNVQNPAPISQPMMLVALPMLLVIILILIIILVFVWKRKLREYQEETEESGDGLSVAAAPHMYEWLD